MAELVTKQIRSAILSGALAPGARIRQEELAERLAVSRAPVRQALVVLTREGLVQNDRLSGAIVAPLDVDLIRGLYQFRGIIEHDVAGTLARRSDFNLGEIKKIISAGRAAAAKKDTARLTELDLQFHTALYDAMENRVLSDIMRGQWTHIRRIMAGTLAIEGYPQQVWDEHAAIVDAIEAHDAEKAAMRALEHTKAASAKLIANLEAEIRRSTEQQEPVVSGRSAAAQTVAARLRKASGPSGNSRLGNAARR